MKASSVFSASCRYMVACCRKYSSQSMLRRASQGHERIMSEWRVRDARRRRYHGVGAPGLGSILIESRNEFCDRDRQALLLNVFATSAWSG